MTWVCAMLFMAQTTIPPVPHLALDSYPSSSRKALQHFYDDAIAHPNDAAAIGALGRALHAWDQWSAAHEAYARAEALAPDAFDWQYLDGLALQRLARHADAASALERALDLKPDYLPARVAFAEALFDAGDRERSARAFESLRGSPAAEPATELGLGRLAAAEGHHDDAIVHLERAVKLFPEWGAAYYALALSYAAVGRRDDAQRALERRAEYGARWPVIDDPVFRTVTSLRDDAQTNLQRGLKLAEAGDLEGAIAAHEAALALDPMIAQAHANLISLYGRARNWARAEDHYRAVVALGFNLGDAHNDYGVLLSLQDKWDEAAAAYRKAIAVNPRHANAWNNLGQALERLRDVHGAADAYRHAVDAEPAFRVARFNLGRMLIALGKADEAVAALEKLTDSRDAESPRYLFALATAHVHAGHRADGVKWASEAKALALQFGQNELAAAIERELATLK